MARSITSSVRDHLENSTIQPALFVKLEFDGKYGVVRVWTGVGDVTMDGEIYSGIGNLGGISAYKETSELKATGMSFTLGGIHSSLISVALAENYQQRRVTMWIAFFDSEISPGLLDDPMIIFRGRMDTMDIKRGPETSVVQINAESIFMALERAPMKRYLPEDHNIFGLAPSSLGGFTVYDKGFDYMPTIQDKQVYWGGLGPSNV